MWKWVFFTLKRPKCIYLLCFKDKIYKNYLMKHGNSVSHTLSQSRRKKAWRSAAECNNTWCWGFRHCRCCFVYFLYMRLFPLFLCSHYMWKHKRYTDTNTRTKNSFMKKQFWRCRWFLVFSYSSDCFPFWLLFKRGRHSHADTTIMNTSKKSQRE